MGPGPRLNSPDGLARVPVLPLLNKVEGLQGRFGHSQVRVHAYQLGDIMLLRGNWAYDKDIVLEEAVMETEE